METGDPTWLVQAQACSASQTLVLGLLTSQVGTARPSWLPSWPFLERVCPVKVDRLPKPLSVDFCGTLWLPLLDLSLMPHFLSWGVESAKEARGPAVVTGLCLKRKLLSLLARTRQVKGR